MVRLSCATILFLLAHGCATPPQQQLPDPAPLSTPEVKPEPGEEPKPEPLLRREDKSRETDYDLAAYAVRFSLAEVYARSGKRAAAAFVLSGIKSRLDETAVRERHFVNLKTAEAFAGAGPDREWPRAEAIIRQVELSAADDPRLLADAQMTRCVCSLGADNLAQAEADGLAALDFYERAEAHKRYVEAARFLLRAFALGKDMQRALRFSRLGYLRAREIDDPAGLALMALDAALVCFRADSPALGYEYLDEAYAASVAAANAWLRNTVIAAAVAQHAQASNPRDVVRWGERLRDETFGKLPTLEASSLDVKTYALTLAHYALALSNLGTGSESRRRESLAAAQAALESALDQKAEGAEQAELEALEEKVRSTLLQFGGG